MQCHDTTGWSFRGPLLVVLVNSPIIRYPSSSCPRRAAAVAVAADKWRLTSGRPDSEVNVSSSEGHRWNCVDVTAALSIVTVRKHLRQRDAMTHFAETHQFVIIVLVHHEAQKPVTRSQVCAFSGYSSSYGYYLGNYVRYSLTYHVSASHYTVSAIDQSDRNSKT